MQLEIKHDRGSDMKKVIITINRENGSGGREIACRLGEILDLKVYDKAILESIVEKYHLDKEEIERIKAKKLNFWDDLCQFYKQSSSIGLGYQSEEKKVTSRELYYAEAEIMRNLARQESCNIVGRSAFHVFKDNPDAIRIFIIADREARIRRVIKKKDLSEKDAAKLTDETDAARETFTKYFAGTSRYDARNYDLVVNVTPYTIEDVASSLAENVRKKMND